MKSKLEVGKFFVGFITLLLVIRGLNLGVLFDRSGGKGVLPASWPAPIDPFYSGYAGGLGPDSLADQLPKIAESLIDEQSGLGRSKPTSD